MTQQDKYQQRLAQGATAPSPRTLSYEERILDQYFGADERRRSHGAGDRATIADIQAYAGTIRLNACARAIRSLMTDADYKRYRDEVTKPKQVITPSPGEQATLLV